MLKDDVGSILKGKSGRIIGTLVGFVIGILIIIPKIFFLLICIFIGYFIGKYFDGKKSEVLIDRETERIKK